AVAVQRQRRERGGARLRDIGGGGDRREIAGGLQLAPLIEEAAGVYGERAEADGRDGGERRDDGGRAARVAGEGLQACQHGVVLSQYPPRWMAAVLTMIGEG